MKVLVTTKYAIDYQVKVIVKKDHSGVETKDVQMSMNPFDAIAVEACVAMQEAKQISSSTVVNIGCDDTVCRQALAMGIDHAAQITAEELDPYQKALLLYDYIQDNNFDMVIMGKLGIDGEHSQIPSMLAGMLDWPCATFASNIKVDGKKIIIDRETDDGISTVQQSTPCIVSCDLRLNTPRFVALPKLLAAKKQPIDIIKPQNIPKNAHTIKKVSAPKIKKGNPPVKDLDTFIQQLLDGGVIK